jgi:sec-independent protein translocase protein TatB
MLDIGFSELMVIGVVALVVLGPERLPRVARTAGHLLGRFQRYVSQVKADINREIELADLKKLQTSVEDAARSIETSVKTGMDEAEHELRSVEGELKKAEEEIRSAVPQMPHMGMGGALGGHAGDAPPALAPTDPAPRLADSSATTQERSPQMELGLGASTSPDPTKPA